MLDSSDIDILIEALYAWEDKSAKEEIINILRKPGKPEEKTKEFIDVLHSQKERGKKVTSLIVKLSTIQNRL
jgi:hypothetical protein